VVVFSSKDFSESSQLCVYEDRSHFPHSKAPLREPMEGEKHDDFVPVCIV